MLSITYAASNSSLILRDETVGQVPWRALAIDPVDSSQLVHHPLLKLKIIICNRETHTLHPQKAHLRQSDYLMSDWIKKFQRITFWTRWLLWYGSYIFSKFSKEVNIIISIVCHVANQNIGLSRVGLNIMVINKRSCWKILPLLGCVKLLVWFQMRKLVIGSEVSLHEIKTRKLPIWKFSYESPYFPEFLGTFCL